jgi:hypothetical protein
MTAKRMALKGSATAPTALRAGPQGAVMDRWLFYALFATLTLFQLQLAVPFLAALPIREALYAYLYARLFLCYRPLNYRNRVLLLFLACTVAIAVLTFLQYSPSLGYRGFARFVNCALIAPLAAEMLNRERDFRICLWIWVCVVFGGCITLAMQFFSFGIPWLTLQHQSTRGGLTRYMTLLGEPNIGGMAAALLLITMTELARSWVLRCAMAACALAFLTLSLSKGGLMGAGIAICMLLFRGRAAIRRLFVPLAIISAILAVGGGGMLSFGGADTAKIERYVYVAKENFLGDADQLPGSTSLIKDLRFRVLEKPSQSMGLDQSESLPRWFTVLFGGSYGIAGSVAKEERGLVGIDNLPHNTFSEIFLVGGALFLLVFLMLLVRTGQSLYRYASNRGGLAATAWPAFIVLCAYLFSYPVIYAPVLGAWFWLTVGLSLNSRIVGERAERREQSATRWTAQIRSISAQRQCG